MFTEERVVSSSAVYLLSPFAVAFGVTAAIAASTTWYVQNLYLQPSVKMNPASFGWLKDVPLSLETAEANIVATEQDEIQVQIPAIILANPSKSNFRNQARRPSSVSHRPARKKVVEPSVAPIPVLKDVVIATQSSSKSEAQVMFQMHESLRVRFWLAVNTQAEPGLTTQIAETPVPQTSTQFVAGGGGGAGPSESPLSAAINPESPDEMKAELGARTKKNSKRQRHLAIAGSLAAESPAENLAKTEFQVDTAASSLAPAPPARESEEATGAERELRFVRSATSSVAGAIKQIQVESDQGGYSILTTQSSVIKISKPSAKPRHKATAAPEIYGPPAPEGFVESSIRRPDGNAGTARTNVREQLALVGVEAFDWDTIISDFESVPLSHEGRADQVSSHWVVHTVRNRFPTVAWQSMSQRQQKVPFVSENTLLSLEQIASIQLQADTSVVFGWIPNGYSVEISGRSERVMYFDQDDRLVNAEDPNQSPSRKYFALLNVEPGAHIVTLISPSGKEQGTVALPALANHSTFLDLRSTSYRTVSGSVYDASTAKLKGLRALKVKVVGQPGAEALTRENGDFTIHNVRSFDDHPIYLEVTADSGFTHRYRLKAGTEFGAHLFRMSEQQVREWLDQLQGNISPESGLMVAAVPEVLAKKPNDALFPAFETFSANPNLIPETYAISTPGYLLPTSPLSNEQPRFLSLQIPSGPAVTRIEDQTNQTVWSQLFYASPGVINVISD